MSHFLTALKALSDETRWRLVHLLLTQDLCGKALAGRLGVSEAAVSQHLKILREAGLVDGEKRGYWIHYSVEREALQEIIAELGRMVRQTASPPGNCRRIHAERKGYAGKEVITMCCLPCCEQPDKLKGKPQECTPAQIKECHGDVKKHPCEGEMKKER